eukprot:CAMPEP_0171777304 /NCGR_PEP_ID=MMETSP0991-20121206/57707_1 /TAXON_ID=483369 /ORGANISM="non described non described, Strain CCMP2098" /LENGTH=496 /DNA_ID=CAMNT_0012384003 /DNA_START=124 /DNA_END=1615 /DNA_ORIENTATION=+
MLLSSFGVNFHGVAWGDESTRFSLDIGSDGCVLGVGKNVNGDLFISGMWAGGVEKTPGDVTLTMKNIHGAWPMNLIWNGRSLTGITVEAAIVGGEPISVSFRRVDTGIGVLRFTGSWGDSGTTIAMSIDRDERVLGTGSNAYGDFLVTGSWPGGFTNKSQTVELTANNVYGDWPMKLLWNGQKLCGSVTGDGRWSRGIVEVSLSCGAVLDEPKLNHSVAKNQTSDSTDDKSLSPDELIDNPLFTAVQPKKNEAKKKSVIKNEVASRGLPASSLSTRSISITPSRNSGDAESSNMSSQGSPRKVERNAEDNSIIISSRRSVHDRLYQDGHNRRQRNILAHIDRYQIDATERSKFRQRPPSRSTSRSTRNSSRNSTGNKIDPKNSAYSPVSDARSAAREAKVSAVEAMHSAAEAEAAAKKNDDEIHEIRAELESTKKELELARRDQVTMRKELNVTQMKLETAENDILELRGTVDLVQKQLQEKPLAQSVRDNGIQRP